ncbi:hypothetical protein AB0N17_07410 [Streptomyces sp. NPDC051133]|uniref:hypothetical protein n=1 Tax=Streptomyces sp. NPDC051133 TaxID=3155521 RepID=UPI00342D7903
MPWNGSDAVARTPYGTPVLEGLEGPAPCPSCAGTARWQGAQVLLADDSLRWDTEVVCPRCGGAVAACGRELPAGPRERMLAEHGRTELRLGPSADRVTVMRVLRRELGIGLGEVRALLERGYGGTFPETELLARKLRAVGVDARAVRGTGEFSEGRRSSPP